MARQHDEPGYAVAARATGVLVRAQDKLLRHLTATRSAAQLTAMFEVPAPMAAQIDWTTVASAGPRMLRADIIPTDSGYYFCELNHFPGGGAGESYHSAHAFAERLNRPVAGVSPFRHLAELYVTLARRAGLTRVVILDSPQHRAQGFGESVMLKRYLRLMAPDLTTAYLDEDTYPPGWLHPDEAERTLLTASLPTMTRPTPAHSWSGCVTSGPPCRACSRPS